MEIDDFQELSKRTAPDEGQLKNSMNLALGLIGESGEVIDLLKKFIFHKAPVDKEKLQEELGDLLWYIVNIATEFDISMEDVLECNVEKLWKRYPNGFSPKASIERVDTKK